MRQVFYIAVYMRQRIRFPVILIILIEFFSLYEVEAQTTSTTELRLLSSDTSNIESIGIDKDVTQKLSRDFTNKDGYEEREFARSTSAEEDCLFIRMIIGRDVGHSAEDIARFIDKEIFKDESEVLLKFSHRYIDGHAAGFYIYKYGQRQNNHAYTQAELRDKAKFYAKLGSAH